MTRLIDVALGEWGEAERHGADSNPRILEYLRSAGLSSTTDGTPWCGAFMAWCAARCGVVPPPHPAAARSWLTVGQAVSGPALGDIVVLERGERWQGHVAFFICRRGNMIPLLGGNQGDRVGIADYDTSRVLGYRRIG